MGRSGIMVYIGIEMYSGMKAHSDSHANWLSDSSQLICLLISYPLFLKKGEWPIGSSAEHATWSWRNDSRTAECPEEKLMCLAMKLWNK